MLVTLADGRRWELDNQIIAFEEETKFCTLWVCLRCGAETDQTTEPSEMTDWLASRNPVRFDPEPCDVCHEMILPDGSTEPTACHECQGLGYVVLAGRPLECPSCLGDKINRTLVSGRMLPA